LKIQSSKKEFQVSKIQIMDLAVKKVCCSRYQV